MKEKLKENWKFIVAMIFVAVITFTAVIGFNYGKDCHWIFKEVPFDISCIDPDHEIRTKVNIEKCNTMTIRIDNFFTAASDDTLINGINGTIIYHGVPIYEDQISITTWMFNEDLVTLNIGDIITVSGRFDYICDKICKKESIHIGSSVDCLFVGHPARFSTTMEE